ncbi:MAG: hypothetical protein DRH17_09325 [Deltaproteobacteria bacterium]|nr:MAG: hypothetical protein DRH17_09325 [Deltaproteobacteria bacterium]
MNAYERFQWKFMELKDLINEIIKAGSADDLKDLERCFYEVEEFFVKAKRNKEEALKKKLIAGSNWTPEIRG